MPNKGKGRAASGGGQGGLLQRLENMVLMKLLGGDQPKSNDHWDRGGYKAEHGSKGARSTVHDKFEGNDRKEWKCNGCGFATNRRTRSACYKCGTPRAAQRPPHQQAAQQAQRKAAAPASSTCPTTTRQETTVAAERGKDAKAQQNVTTDATDEDLTDIGDVGEAIKSWRTAAACKSKASVVTDTAMAHSAASLETEMEEDDGDILGAELLKAYRAIAASARGAKAEHALACIRAHEKATTAKAARKPIGELNLEGLQADQAVARIQERLAHLESQRADHAAKCNAKEAEDEAAAQKLLGGIKVKIDELQKMFDEVKAEANTEKEKWRALHNQQREAFDAKVAAATAMLEAARKDPSKLIKPAATEDSPTQRQQQQQQQQQQQMDVVMAEAKIRPVACLPQVTIQDERHLARLAKAQAVIEQAAQQDLFVELTLADIGLTAAEAEHLVGEGEWAEKFPKERPGETASADAAVDLALPKRIVALIGKAISLIEISAVAKKTAQEAAEATVAQVAAAGGAWRTVGKAGKTAKTEPGRQPY